jgi:hypothetical protein
MLFVLLQSNHPSQFLQDIPKHLVESNSHLYADLGSATISSHQIGHKPIPSEDSKYSNYINKSAGSNPFDYNNSGNQASDLKDGDKVNHPTFGTGIIINVLGGVATVAFNDRKIGIKKLALSVATLEKI